MANETGEEDSRLFRPRRRAHRIFYFLLQCMSPLLALSGHTEASVRLSAFGAKRTSRERRERVGQQQYFAISAAFADGLMAWSSADRFRLAISQSMEKNTS